MAFEIGQLVGLRADPARQGSIIEILSSVAGSPRYRVFHSASDIREYHEEQLLSLDQRGHSTFFEALVAKNCIEPKLFRARITAARLSHPQNDSLYSLQAARIQYIPFQFKPLLRFLRADQPRLLIADEVGVGKTIEAGLILRELQTRQAVDNILIVCPKALVTKWQAEMRRFDEDFRPLTAESFRYCLNETELDGAWPIQYNRAIVHLELLRNEDYITGTTERRTRPGLLTLIPPPHFSLVIFDEAHHLRNPETNSHRVASFLCDVSESVVMLSATPVHVGSQNLFTLLRLLRPDLFPDENVFAQMVEPNQHIIRCMRHIRTRFPEENWLEAAVDALNRALATNWGNRVLRHDPRFSEWYNKLGESTDISDQERIRCLRDLEEVLSLAHIMNRTRRRDIGRFTIREPHTVSVPFTEPQQEFYKQLIDFRRQVLALDYHPRVIRLITDTLERQASSCLPALVPMLDTFLRSGTFRSEAITDDLEWDTESLELPPSLIALANELRSRAADMPPGDPKYERLEVIIDRALEVSIPRKVLVFSFFLHTLRYLGARLREKGYRVAVITGSVSEDERQALRSRFRLPFDDSEALDVLLSSEVGCEGLDYEFCDCLVNYDIPWNPMRIEQRIGRIDRFGQSSPKVLIYNFITPGTVEERIFFRCFDRLGIFRETVGDLEEILGEIVQNLNLAAFDPTLTLQQAEEQAQQTADNAIRLFEEQRRLEAEGSAFLGLDEMFLEELETLISEGRFVSPQDLYHMVKTFVEQPEIGGGLSEDTQQPNIYRLRLNKEARGEVSARVRTLPYHNRDTLEFMRWLDGYQPHLSLTFDQNVAVEQRQLPFVTPIHALARAAILYWENTSTPLVTQLSLRSDLLDAGGYLFIVDLWETIGLRKELKLTPFVWDLGRQRLSRELSSQLLYLIEQSATEAVVVIDDEEIERGLVYLDEAAYQERLRVLAEHRQRNEYLLAQQMASLEGYYRNRLRRVEQEIAQATNERIRRMKKAEFDRIQLDFTRKHSDIEDRRKTDILSQRIAAGILCIERE